MISRSECKKIIIKIAAKHKIDPKLIIERLLNEDDKQDMLEGNLSIETLECAVQCWKEAGMPDYAQGETEACNPYFGFP